MHHICFDNHLYDSLACSDRAGSCLNINAGFANIKYEFICTNNGLNSATFMSLEGKYSFTSITTFRKYNL